MFYFRTGTLKQFFQGIGALHALKWTHHMEGQEDIGKAYAITPKTQYIEELGDIGQGFILKKTTSSNVDFNLLPYLFNQ